MNLAELEAFLSVAESGSFSSAAEHLHVTQPAVSKRISALENSLNQTLFDRVGKKVLLTQAGHLLVPRAEAVFAMLEDTERDLKNLAAGVRGTLNLATSHHIGLHRLAPVLKAFSDGYPDVKLNITFEDSEVTHELVRQGSIELAVATLNPEGDPALHYERIWHDPLVFVSDKPRTARLGMPELAEEPCVLPGTGTYTGRIVMQTFQSAGINLQPTMSTNYLETIGMLVSVGLGWSILPASMVGTLDVLDVQAPRMARDLGWIRNPARSMSNAAQAFVDVLTGFSDQPPT